MCAFWSQSQISFKGVSPQSVVGSYEFTYTSDPIYADPWGHSLKTTGYYVEDTLMLVSDALVAPSLVSVSPISANAGQTLDVTITGLNTRFIQGSATSAFFGFSQGSGTVINSLTVNSKTSVTANITIPATVENGKYNVGVSEYLDGKLYLKNAFEVKNGLPSSAPSISTVSPITVVSGTTLDVTITGSNTHFVQGSTTVNFGFNQGSSTLNSVTVNSATQLVANVTIADNTYAGDYDIVTNNPLDGKISLIKGFKVTGTARPEISTVSPISVDLTGPIVSGKPTSIEKTLDVTITGLNTHFTQGSPTANFIFNQGSNTVNAFTVNSITVNSATQLVANVKIPATAYNGDYNISIVNPVDGLVTLNNGFKVIGGVNKLSISPATGIRGATLVVSITGDKTHFKSGSATLSFNFNDPYGVKVVSTLSNSTETKMTARIKVPFNIYPGVYDMTVSNSIDGTITLPNAFTVTAGTTPTDSLGCGDSGNDLTGKIAVIYRGDCYFYKKIKYAQDNGARAAVIINNVSGSPAGMRGGTATENALITIPAIQISQGDGAMFRKEMEKGPVVAIIGNLSGYYQDNISLYKNYAKIPRAYATPSLTVKDPTEMNLSLGASLFNRGSRTANSATLTVEVKKGTEVLFSATSTPVTILKDTLADIDFPDYSLSEYSIGKYSVTYTANLNGIQDLYLTDNTLTLNFEITDNIYSLAPLNDNGIPIVTTYAKSAGTNLTSFMQCIKYENANANRIGAEGIYFSATVDTLSIDKEEFNMQVFRWDDVFNPNVYKISDNFLQLNEVSSTIYYMDGDLQDTVLYVPFKESVVLENDTKYLFCITPTTNNRINLGYNSAIDYTLNNFVFEELTNPLRSTTDVETWYSGFTSHIVPAFGIRTADKNTLGISEVNKIEGMIYPNPSNDAVTISLNAEGVAKLVVTDIMGKVVMNNSINLTNGKTRVDINSIQSGMYIFNVILENGTSSQFNIVKK